MPIEGQFTLSLTTTNARVTAARLASSRPVHACRVLSGEVIANVPRKISLLYRICGHAQTLAAVEACEHAAGIRAPGSTRLVRECLVLAEMIREHAWRLLLDWPGLLGQEPAMAAFKAIQGSLTALPRALCPRGDCWGLGSTGLTMKSEDVFPVLHDLEQLLTAEMVADEILSETNADQWPRCGIVGSLVHTIRRKGWQGLGASDVEPLPPISLACFNTRLQRADSDEFLARPSWRGHVHETGPSARSADFPPLMVLQHRYGRGLLARLTARVMELLQLPERLRRLLEGQGTQSCVAAFSPEPGVGLAAVESARGRLLHRVVLQQDSVRRYQILAPTEWNFHPNGPLIRGLRGLAADDAATLEKLAAMAVVALDPCVGYRIRVE